MTRALMACKCLAILVFLGLITGCWDRKEMDDLALIMASGFDITDDGQIEVTLQIALPTGIPSAVQTGGSGKKSVVVLSAKGSSASEAAGRLQQQLSRILYFGHRGVIVFGEEYARHGLNQVLDAFSRLPESRYNGYVVTSYGSTAKEILNQPYQLELIPSIGINKMQSSKMGFSVKIDQFLDALSSQGRSPVTSAIRILHKDSDKETFSIDRAAVYLGNKLSGFLEPDELKLLRWWIGETQQVKFTIQLEPEEADYKGTLGVELLQSGIKIRTAVKNPIPEVWVSFHALVRAIDNDTKLDLSSSNIMKRVETQLSKQIQTEIESMLVHVQKNLKSDIFGIGEEIHIEHPYAWKKIRSKWTDIYPLVPVTVDVNIDIERTGKTQTPVHIKKTD
ncbi:Ger(x)C family spore germination protein [Paenibacillus sp. 19GGS1-52]|uniref:Ger(x)C family spore germination protein n=1 Tax=Paenibacillus sp. 19GGS1-52 TaxID=2758563 RepID=UPI001EFAFE5C|nr:Ger(x)C family spore germination protein [Paenibacillus sp. 19GGS1-52]ULO06869.1 Ger(x)C family spore germination protein [Paenibacillus sp. 19GGS1-52]